MTAAIVFVLCALTSLACAVLLLRGYRERRVRLLLWSGICFSGFAISNALLIVDAFFVPDTSLALIRSLPTLFGLGALMYGLVWEAST